MKRLSRIHLLLGLLSVLAFLGTGAYMRMTLPPPDEATHLMRMTYRSSHVYLLLAGLINVITGIYLVGAEAQWRRRMQVAGSMLLLAAPFIVLLAFFIEPQRASLDRPLTLLAALALLAGTLSHLAGRTRK